MNFLLLNLNATATETKTQYTINDLWKCLSPYVYIVAENLLEMLFVTCPVDVSCLLASFSKNVDLAAVLCLATVSSVCVSVIVPYRNASVTVS